MQIQIPASCAYIQLIANLERIQRASYSSLKWLQLSAQVAGTELTPPAATLSLCGRGYYYPQALTHPTCFPQLWHPP